MEKRKKILVLNPPLKLREVSRQLSKRVQLIRGYYRDIEVIISSTDIRILVNGRDIRKYDYVWVTGSWSKRDIAHIISLYLTHHKRPHTVVSEGSGTSKLVDMALYALNGIPQPHSYYCINSEYTRRAESIAAVCKFPLVAKDVRGTFGRKSYLLADMKALKRLIFVAGGTTDYIFQKYIPNTFDWGIIVGNGTILSAEKSYRNKKSGTFMNHAAAGAVEVFVEPSSIPKEIAAMALEANRLLSLTWARSDIIIDETTHKPYILETNRSPRMTSGSNEVKAFATFIESFNKEITE